MRVLCAPVLSIYRHSVIFVRTRQEVCNMASSHLPSAGQSNPTQSAPKVNAKGEFVRNESAFRDWVTADGSSGFQAESGRYHVYVSLACPWAHRVLVTLNLKGLEHAISYTVVDWLTSDMGWQFTDQKPRCSLDTVNNCQYLRQVYNKVDPEYSGRVTVPCLWDKQKGTIVNNESSEIIRMLNSEFNALCESPAQAALDLYPEALRDDIDAVNSWIYSEINNGVYKCGFAGSQEAYDTAVRTLFSALDRVESILSKTRYLTGNQLTEADVRLFTTLVRFDLVYVGHFKCNKKRIVDYPSLWPYLRDLYQTGGIRDTVDRQHITHHYQQSQKNINPLGIVAIGPDLDFTEPHGRDKMAS